MEEGLAHLTVVVGNSVLAEDLRRMLVQHDVHHIGVAAHMRGLRSTLVLGEHECMVVCIALDEATMQRHGAGLRQLLADQRCFSSRLRSVGLLTDLGLTRDVAALGCDIFVADTDEAFAAICCLGEKGADRTTRQLFHPDCEFVHGRFTDRIVWSHGLTEAPADLLARDRRTAPDPADPNPDPPA